MSKRPSQNPPICLDGCVVLRDTARAIHVMIPDADDDEIWIPRSQLADDCELSDEGDEGTLLISAWWAQKRGLV